MDSSDPDGGYICALSSLAPAGSDIAIGAWGSAGAYVDEFNSLNALSFLTAVRSDSFEVDAVNTLSSVGSNVGFDTLIALGSLTSVCSNRVDLGTIDGRGSADADIDEVGAP